MREQSHAQLASQVSMVSTHPLRRSHDKANVHRVKEGDIAQALLVVNSNLLLSDVSAYGSK